ncbi:hypothetical protein, partial [Enterobacter intestinihominis]
FVGRISVAPSGKRRVAVPLTRPTKYYFPDNFHLPNSKSFLQNQRFSPFSYKKLKHPNKVVWFK